MEGFEDHIRYESMLEASGAIWRDVMCCEQRRRDDRGSKVLHRIETFFSPFCLWLSLYRQPEEKIPEARVPRRYYSQRDCFTSIVEVC